MDIEADHVVGIVVDIGDIEADIAVYIEADIIVDIEADIEADIAADIVVVIEADIVADILADILADIEAYIVSKKDIEAVYLNVGAAYSNAITLDSNVANSSNFQVSGVTDL